MLVSLAYICVFSITPRLLRIIIMLRRLLVMITVESYGVLILV